MEVKVVLGSLFGDEGKGVTTQWLVRQALAQNKSVCVVRFSGGPQAAHTIVNNGIEHICSTYGSGVLLGVPTAYIDSAYFDPICAYNEYKVLQDKGIEPKLFMMPVNLITPYDVFAGRQDAKVLADGTCGKGLFPTYIRHRTLNFEQVVPDKLFSIAHSKEYLKKARRFYNTERNKYVEDLFQEAVENLPINKSTGLANYDVLIFEGTQGLLLDMDNGFFPNVTPSRVGLNGIPIDFLKDAEIYLVSRTYLTRHGNGYIPKNPCTLNLEGKHETNVTNQYQGEFKIGDYELPLLQKAIDRHRLDNYIPKYHIKYNMVFTHMDVMDNAEDFAKSIVKELTLPIENIYGNYSPESNLILL